MATLNELSKYHKFGYRRKHWSTTSTAYVYYDHTNNKWLFKGHDNSDTTILSVGNSSKTDWEISPYINKHYTKNP